MLSQECFVCVLNSESYVLKYEGNRIYNDFSSQTHPLIPVYFQSIIVGYANINKTYITNEGLYILIQYDSESIKDAICSYPHRLIFNIDELSHGTIVVERIIV